MKEGVEEEDEEEGEDIHIKDCKRSLRFRDADYFFIFFHYEVKIKLYLETIYDQRDLPIWADFILTHLTRFGPFKFCIE